MLQQINVPALLCYRRCSFPSLPSACPFGRTFVRRGNCVRRRDCTPTNSSSAHHPHTSTRARRMLHPLTMSQTGAQPIPALTILDLLLEFVGCVSSTPTHISHCLHHMTNRPPHHQLILPSGFQRVPHSSLALLASLDDSLSLWGSIPHPGVRAG